MNFSPLSYKNVKFEPNSPFQNLSKGLILEKMSSQQSETLSVEDSKSKSSPETAVKSSSIG
jgi:hypothetical protein